MAIPVDCGAPYASKFSVKKRRKINSRLRSNKVSSFEFDASLHKSLHDDGLCVELSSVRLMSLYQNFSKPIIHPTPF